MKSSAALAISQAQFFAHPKALVESDDIGPRTRVWAFVHVMKGARIGSDCNIGDHAYIESDVCLGDNVTVKNGVAIWTGVTVEDNAFLGPNCVFTNDPNPRAYIKKAANAFTPTVIRANATIGANATIVCGVTIGRYAFVGAGTVIIRSVPDFALMVGNPARQIGWMCVCAHKLPLKVDAIAGTRCKCVHCGTLFEKTYEGLTCAGLTASVGA